MPSKAFLLASLNLWRRRYKWRNARLRVAQRDKNSARITKWTKLLHVAAAMIHRRERQLRGPQNWCPFARKLVRNSPGPLDRSFVGKIVWHTTEGDSDATPTLDANGDWPHFEIQRDGSIIQYLPLDHMAAALRHLEPTPTNAAHAIQIEVVGHASRPRWPQSQKLAARRLARWIETNSGVTRRAGVMFRSPTQATAGWRLTNEQWLRYSGHCGHQHVPQNDHVDPGAIDINFILENK